MYNPYFTEETFFVATKCCIIKNWKILILSENRLNKPLWWELPGGKISKSDYDLLPTESLVRELKEELWDNCNILPSELSLFMVYKSYEDTTFSDKKVPFIFLCYLYRISTEVSIELSHEHTELRWISESEIESIPDWRWGFDEIVSNAFLYASKA